MKLFKLKRVNDSSGISGTGIVIEGAIFSSGICVIQWITSKMPNSISIFESFDDFKKIHIDTHPENRTEIIWLQ